MASQASQALIGLIERQDVLDRTADTLQPVITDVFKAGGETGQQVKNFLHGTWLGHPLHPVITDVPIGAWTAALALDAVEAISGRDGLGGGADAAIAVGLVGSVGAALTGMTDWSNTDGRARKVGLMHGLLNAGATALYATSLVLRRGNNRRAGVGFSMLGFAVSATAAYLGGHLVFAEQIGVNHSGAQEAPKHFVPVMDEQDLPEGQLTKADANGIPVLLVRYDGKIHAIAETCSHMGGPLSEGKLDGDIVQCPWHGSRFSIEDGSVVDGPATFPQPCFETRVTEGKIEIRARD
jgi:nitrite reductase/ring-hydroxylating ferredoxin subunit/uncharacterized membrane protein